MQFTFDVNPDAVIQALEALEGMVEEESAGKTIAAEVSGDASGRHRKLLLGEKELRGAVHGPTPKNKYHKRSDNK